MCKLITLCAIVTALAVTQASAADMSPVVITAAPISWAGLYAGLHAGIARSKVSVADNAKDGVNPGPFGYNANGGFGGGQVGYNFQFGNIVTGIEGELGYMGLTGKGRISSASATSHQDLTLDSGLYADLTARLGYAFGSSLIYGKGGWAYFKTNAMQATTNPGYDPTGTGALTGWTLGAGYEYRVSQNVGIKVEYQHFDFGSKGGYQTNVGDFSSPIGYKFTNEHKVRLDTIKVGLNYYF